MWTTPEGRRRSLRRGLLRRARLARWKAAQLFDPHYRRLMPMPLQRHLAYVVRHRRPAYLPCSEPATFTGKVQWRILNDRREILKPLNDKLRVKEIGAAAGIASPRTLWSGTDPAELSKASQSFKGLWVLKPNHGSQVVRFCEGPIGVEDAIQATAGWVDLDVSKLLGEWHATFARKLILAEESVAPPDGGDLHDYKAFVFDGRPVIMLVCTGRFGSIRHTYYRLPDWVRLDISDDNAPPGPAVAPPPELPLLIDAATRLGQDWDFIRVDMYARDGQVWLGELTPTPAAARTRIIPESFDRWLGDQWTLPDLTQERRRER